MRQFCEGKFLLCIWGLSCGSATAAAAATVSSPYIGRLSYWIFSCYGEWSSLSGAVVRNSLRANLKDVSWSVIWPSGRIIGKPSRRSGLGREFPSLGSRSQLVLRGRFRWDQCCGLTILDALGTDGWSLLAVSPLWGGVLFLHWRSQVLTNLLLWSGVKISQGLWWEVRKEKTERGLLMGVSNPGIKKNKWSDQQKKLTKKRKALLNETDSSAGAWLWIQLGSVVGA